MNFGGKIMVLYAGFVLLIVGLVFMCFRQDVELVSADYYGQELRFQEKIDAMNNEKRLPHSISHTILKDRIVLSLDTSIAAEALAGNITLFRPSDARLDKQYPMKFVNHEQVIDRKDLSRGVYKLQLSWTSGQQHYFREDVIYIN